MALSLLSALEQLARYAREEGLTDQDIFLAVARECEHGHVGRLRIRAQCRQCDTEAQMANYVREVAA